MEPQKITIKYTDQSGAGFALSNGELIKACKLTLFI